MRHHSAREAVKRVKRVQSVWEGVAWYLLQGDNLENDAGALRRVPQRAVGTVHGPGYPPSALCSSGSVTVRQALTYTT